MSLKSLLFDLDEMKLTCFVFSSQSIRNFAHSSFQYALDKAYPLYMR